MQDDESVPHHDLSSIQQLCRWRWRGITYHAAADAQALGFDEDDIDECVLGLTSTDFYKSMPSFRCQGRYQDVYRPMYSGKRLYVKLDMDPDWLTIISFEEDTSR